MGTAGMLKFTGLAAATAAGIVFSAVAAGAQSQPTITLAPDNGGEGDPFTLSGEGCVIPDEDYGGVVVAWFVEVGGGDPEGQMLGHVIAEDDGSWSVDVTVPAGVDPAADYQVEARCWDDPEPVLLIDYAPAPFDVTGDIGPTTTTTTTRPDTPTTTSTTVKPGTPAPTPTPATPITDPPDFTG